MAWIVAAVACLIIAGILGWFLLGDEGSGGWMDVDTRPIGCLVAALPVGFLILLVVAIVGWIR